MLVQFRSWLKNRGVAFTRSIENGKTCSRQTGNFDEFMRDFFLLEEQTNLLAGLAAEKAGRQGPFSQRQKRARDIDAFAAANRHRTCSAMGGARRERRHPKRFVEHRVGSDGENHLCFLVNCMLVLFLVLLLAFPNFEKRRSS